MTSPSRSILPILFACLLLLAACGGDAPAPVADPGDPAAPPPETPPGATLETPPSPDPREIAFIDGFPAGVEAAGDPDALIFVYVGQHHPT